MKVPRILFLYVAREVVLYMGVGLIGVSHERSWNWHGARARSRPFGVGVGRNRLPGHRGRASHQTPASELAGLLVCGVFCIIYYCTVTFFQYLAVQAVLPVILALWFPNLGLGAVGVARVLRSRRIVI